MSTHDFPRVDVEDYLQAVENEERPEAEVIEARYTLDSEDLQRRL